MPDLVALLTSAFNLMLVVFGFGCLVFVHELGHFLAARWAGIRVLTFAIGIGSTIVSYRPGLGWRRGSSEREFHTVAQNEPGRAERISHTEYTLKWIPLGGFVRMLGQEDLHPDRVSEATDSYQNCPIWKRMIVISAGVIANLILAAALFVFVFMVGLPTSPPLVGAVDPNGAAAQAIAENDTARAAEALGLQGIRPGDRVISIDGEPTPDFHSVYVTFAMAAPGASMAVEVERGDDPDPLRYTITPQRNPQSALLEVGIAPAFTTTLQSIDAGPALDGWLLTAAPYSDTLRPGATLSSIRLPTGETIETQAGSDVARAAAMSEGRSLTLGYVNPDGSTATVETPLTLERQVSAIASQGRDRFVLGHHLGLVPVVSVAIVQNPAAAEAGLAAGDTIARLGPLEYPSLAEIGPYLRERAGESVDAVVRRTGEAGDVQLVELTLPVTRDGRIGFLVQPDAQSIPLFARAVTGATTLEGAPDLTPADRVFDQPGLLVRSVGGVETPTLPDLHRELRVQSQTARDAGTGVQLPLVLELPLPPQADGQRPTVVRVWELDADEVAALHELRWSLPPVLSAFMPAEMTLKADGPLDAIAMGLHRTRTMLANTYLTMARVVQGSIRVSYLNGPVGIAHTGTILASEGPIRLLFFLALISVNLAVVNFLPIPILDGGQFLFLCYEGIRKRPPPIVVQNILTLAGLALIAALFLVVTFNDLRRLFGF